MSEAVTKHPDVDVMINFASLRSAFDATMETLRYPQVRRQYVWLCLRLRRQSVSLGYI